MNKKSGIATKINLVLLSHTRKMCHELAAEEESERWLLRAEQIWHLKNDRFAVQETRELDAETTIILDEVKIPLWQWGADTDDWGEYCKAELGLRKEQARQLERVWDTYHVRKKWEREKLLEAGKSKPMRALSVVEHALEEGKDDKDLEILITDGSWAEVDGYVQAKAQPQTRFNPLEYDGKKISFWDEDNLPLEFGSLTLLDPPADLGRKDKILWKRKQATILSMVGEK